MTENITREQEIDQASVFWFYNEAVNPDLDDAFKAGARYADGHLSQETKNKIFEATRKWLYEHDNCGWIDDVEVSVFLENFKKEVVDKL